MLSYFFCHLCLRVTYRKLCYIVELFHFTQNYVILFSSPLVSKVYPRLKPDLSKIFHQRLQSYRSRWCSIKKGIYKSFAKLTGKHLCQSLFFNKVARLRTATLLKKRLWQRCFPVNFVKFLRTTLDDCF